MNDYTDRYSGLTMADFDALDLSDILASAAQPTTCDFARSLNLKAQELEAKNQFGPAKAAKALADICMYGFSPHSQEQVFSPFMQRGEQRTPAPEDLPSGLLPVLAEVAKKSTEPELRARLGDVCCVRMTKRDRNLSQATAEAYLEAARTHFSAGRFDIGVLRCCRAVDVARNPGPGLVQQIQRAFDDFLANVAPAAPLLEVVQMLELYRSRLDGDGKLLARVTAPFVQKAGAQEQWELQRRFLICQADWTIQAGQQTDAETLYREAAETHVRRAEECKTWKTPNGFVVADHLARAVEAHRRLDRKSSRADQLENEEKATRREAVESLRKQGVPPASLADAYRRLQESKLEIWGSAAISAAKGAQGLSLDEAIRFLVLAHPPPHKAEFETLAKRELETSVWKSLLPETLLDEDGNPFAKAGSYLHENPEGQQKVIEQQMLQHFKSEHVPGAVVVFEAVREQILQDYNLLPDHLVPIVQHSPFIPPGRELLFARGLLAGFNGDFILAAHLLTPQLEDALSRPPKQSGHHNRCRKRRNQETG